MTLRLTMLLQLCVLCLVQTVWSTQEVGSSDADVAVASDMGEQSAAATRPLRYAFHPTYQPEPPPSSASLNYSLVPFSILLGTRQLTGRVVTVHSSPQSHFSVYPPPGGCGGGGSTVSDTAAHWGCEVAMNAGFFQIDQPAAFCLNAVVSDGRLLQEQAQYPERVAQDGAGGEAADGGTSEVSVISSRSSVDPASTADVVPPSPSVTPPASTPQSSLSTFASAGATDASLSISPSARFAHHNVHFGLTSDGRYFVGHVNHSLLEQHSAPSADTWHFTQLLSGVVWLVRDGVSHVQQSWQEEEDQSTPIPAVSFPSMISARTAIGHDSTGRLMLVLVEGKSGASGVGLAGLAELCIRVGMVNGINTDGGGSATLVERGVLVNEPSESKCPNVEFDGQTCERPVTTITCLHPSRRNWNDVLTASSASQSQQEVSVMPILGNCERTDWIRSVEHTTPRHQTQTGQQ